MKFLVDSDVLSEGTKAEPDLQVVQWLRKHQPNLVVSPIVLGELEFGILKLPQGRKREALLSWFEKGVKCMNVLEIDGDTAAHWARLLAELRLKGLAMPIKDSLIAASARQHTLTIITRNKRDFQYAGVALINPFAA